MNENEFDFDTEFMTDEEVEEMLDGFIFEVLGNKIEADENRTAIVNPHRVQQVLCTYEILKRLTRGTNAKVIYDLYEPYKSMGVVSVIGSDLIFGNTEWFTKAMKLASNFEVYSKTDGTVQVDFTFHSLTVAID